MIVVSLLLQAEFGPIDHQEDAHHFSYVSSSMCDPPSLVLNSKTRYAQEIYNFKDTLKYLKEDSMTL